jgi:hypothetical protein
LRFDSREAAEAQALRWQNAQRVLLEATAPSPAAA